MSAGTISYFICLCAYHEYLMITIRSADINMTKRLPPSFHFSSLKYMNKPNHSSPHYLNLIRPLNYNTIHSLRPLVRHGTVMLVLAVLDQMVYYSGRMEVRDFHIWSDLCGGPLSVGPDGGTGPLVICSKTIYMRPTHL